MHSSKPRRPLSCCRQKSPPFYPNLITLDKHLTSKQHEHVYALLEEGLPDEAGIKDSYANLDLNEKGFHILFDGKWICLQASTRMTTKGLKHIYWETITDEGALNQWERAWRGMQFDEPDSTIPMIFLPDLLMDNRICIIAGYEGGQIVAGAIGLLTDQIVGISNVFVLADVANSYRAECIEKLRSIFPDRAMVSYESAGDLKEMLDMGFKQIGSMRVWVRNTID